jgi:hypothetical protein
MKKNQTGNEEIAHVEFGNEFGDINAAKHYEIPFMNQDKKKKERAKRK